MDDVDESEVYDEGDIQDEYSQSSMGDYGRFSIVVSFLRQVMCVSSVALMPYHNPIVGNPQLVLSKSLDLAVLVDQILSNSIMPIIFTLLCTIFMKAFGRKSTIVICNVSFVLLETLFYYDYGDALGLIMVTWQIIAREGARIVFFTYVAEIISSSFRAFFMGFYQLVLIIGIVINHNIFGGKWLMFLSSLLLACCALFISIFVPESPFWLAATGKAEAAEQVFSWIRAGSLDAADVAEFDLLLDAAREREEQGVLLKILSLTFVVCCSFALVLHLCRVNPCDLQQTVMFDFYIKEKRTEADENDAEAYYLFYNKDKNRHLLEILGCLLHLVISIVVGRKIIYLSGFIAGTLLALPALLKIKRGEELARIARYCSMIETTTLMIDTIAVEIFPATTREFGLFVSITFFHTMKQMSEWLSVRMCDKYQPERFYIPKIFVYASYLISTVGIPYLMFFMPETKGRTMYDLREVHLLRRDDEATEEDTFEQLEGG